MRRYTKHLQTILQTQNTCKTQKIQPTPHQNNGAWKEERCSRPLYSSHTTHPHHNNHTPTSAQSSTVQANKTTTTTPTRCGLLCAAPDTQQHANIQNNMFVKQSRPRSATQCICHCGRASTRISKYFSVAVTHSATSTTTRPTTVGTKQKLLRKEVIQPHLPVRLPCYDFVPIADPTFDHSLTRLGHGLRVLPTFMT